MHVRQSHEKIGLVLSRVRGTIRRGQEPDRSRCRDYSITLMTDHGASWLFAYLHLEKLLLTHALRHHEFKVISHQIQIKKVI